MPESAQPARQPRFRHEAVEGEAVGFEMQKRNAAKQEAEDSKADIGWGSQIRSYVLDDQRIKDLRTGVQSSNCDKVLDGDLDQFIVVSLKQGL